jgi:formylglycine-generating enzyme required for sulfatase activity
MRLEEEFRVPADALAKVTEIVLASNWLGFGNPKMSKPAMSRDECRERRSGAKVWVGDDRCPSKNMVLVYDPARQSKEEATVCIDQYEFPNIACEYPIVWVRAVEASALCEALGKRLCWAHEWEGACAGALLSTSDEYPHAALPKYLDEPSRLRDRRVQLEYRHNDGRDVRWAYGATKDNSRCAMGSTKNDSCAVVDYSTCGTNDFPAGAFPQCVSPFGVYDQHGNAAEHMSLPVYPKELEDGPASGWTEMKGSWFVFGKQDAHPDDCRWRAKNWHTTRISERLSHRNYHLGFRCCADVK